MMPRDTDKISFLLRSDGYGHCQGVNQALVLKETKALLTAGQDWMIKLWKFDKSQETHMHCYRTYVGHSGSVSSIAQLTNEARFASASLDRTIRIWDTESSNCLSILANHTDQVKAISFTKSLNLLASGSLDGRILLWDAELLSDPHFLLTPEKHDPLELNVGKSIYSLSFSLDGSLLGSGHLNKLACLWDVRSKGLISSFHHSACVSCLALSSNGRQLATGTTDGFVSVWDVRNLRSVAMVGFDECIRCVVCSDEGGIFRSVVAGLNDGRVIETRFALDEKGKSSAHSGTEDFFAHEEKMNDKSNFSASCFSVDSNVVSTSNTPHLVSLDAHLTPIEESESDQKEEEEDASKKVSNHRGVQRVGRKRRIIDEDDKTSDDEAHDEAVIEIDNDNNDRTTDVKQDVADKPMKSDNVQINSKSSSDTQPQQILRGTNSSRKSPPPVASVTPFLTPTNTPSPSPFISPTPPANQSDSTSPQDNSHPSFIVTCRVLSKQRPVQLRPQHNHPALSLCITSAFTQALWSEEIEDNSNKDESAICVDDLEIESCDALNESSLNGSMRREKIKKKEIKREEDEESESNTNKQNRKKKAEKKKKMESDEPNEKEVNEENKINDNFIQKKDIESDPNASIKASLRVLKEKCPFLLIFSDISLVEVIPFPLDSLHLPIRNSKTICDPSSLLHSSHTSRSLSSDLHPFHIKSSSQPLRSPFPFLLSPSFLSSLSSHLPQPRLFVFGTFPYVEAEPLPDRIHTLLRDEHNIVHMWSVMTGTEVGEWKMRDKKELDCEKEKEKETGCQSKGKDEVMRNNEKNQNDCKECLQNEDNENEALSIEREMKNRKLHSYLSSPSFFISNQQNSFHRNRPLHSNTSTKAFPLTTFISLFTPPSLSSLTSLSQTQSSATSTASTTSSSSSNPIQSNSTPSLPMSLQSSLFSEYRQRWFATEVRGGCLCVSLSRGDCIKCEGHAEQKEMEMKCVKRQRLCDVADNPRGMRYVRKKLGDGDNEEKNLRGKKGKAEEQATLSDENKTEPAKEGDDDQTASLLARRTRRSTAQQATEGSASSASSASGSQPQRKKLFNFAYQFLRQMLSEVQQYHNVKHAPSYESALKSLPALSLSADECQELLQSRFNEERDELDVLPCGCLSIEKPHREHLIVVPDDQRGLYTTFTLFTSLDHEVRGLPSSSSASSMASQSTEERKGRSESKRMLQMVGESTNDSLQMLAEQVSLAQSSASANSSLRRHISPLPSMELKRFNGKEPLQMKEALRSIAAEMRKLGWNGTSDMLSASCNNILLPPETTLATIKARIWNKPEPLLIHYHLKQE
ncbi:putative WD40 repeat-like protein [Monocercomonoides exilis]|uniref:putative WD40 repeat-like protein n=1 Tax=Monocercomonoides exilis TaxID=2049356 RepID=UPI003559F317|nr:putative WD40 repeat-like protein [Monocercomonoides exilis]